MEVVGPRRGPCRGRGWNTGKSRRNCPDVQRHDAADQQDRGRQHRKRRPPPGDPLAGLHDHYRADQPPDPADVRADTGNGHQHAGPRGITQTRVTPTEPFTGRTGQPQQSVRYQTPHGVAQKNDRRRQNQREQAGQARSQKHIAPVPAGIAAQTGPYQQKERNENRDVRRADQDDRQQGECTRVNDRTARRQQRAQPRGFDQHHPESARPTPPESASPQVQPGNTLRGGAFRIDPIGRPEDHVVHVDAAGAGHAVEAARNQVAFVTRSVVTLTAVGAAETHVVGRELVLRGQEGSAAFRAAPGFEIPELVIADAATHERITRYQDPMGRDPHARPRRPG